MSTLLFTTIVTLAAVADPEGTCSAHGDCRLGERCEHRECVPHKPRGGGKVADCNPGRKDPPKEGDKPPPVVYNPKV
jgi:hypothetical protein